MKLKKPTFIGRDLTVLIPTKDRPQKVKNLLESIALQSVKCGRIILVNGGAPIDEVVFQYQGILPIECYQCYPPGQLNQRNFGIRLLDENTKLVACFDDDIELDFYAFEKMLNFWNQVDENTAAVAFNIVNAPPHKHTWYKQLMCISGKNAGAILKSGFNTSLASVGQNLKVEWVPGGATVWRKDILINHRHLSTYSKWASCEDLIFSFPIGKKFPLYICAESKVRHEHVYGSTSALSERFYGKTETIWRYYFVATNPDLSVAGFFWGMFCLVFGRLCMSILTLQKRHFEFALGQVMGLKKCFLAYFKNSDPKNLFDEC